MMRLWILRGGAVAASLWGLRLLQDAWKQWTLRNRLENLPTARVRSAAMGPVEVYGALEESTAVKAPFSGTSCIFARWTVEASAGGAWKLLDQGTSGKAFLLKDKTGQLDIAVDNTRWEGAYSYQITTNDSPHFIPDPGVKAWMTVHPHNPFTGPLRFTEWTLKPRQELFVRGTLTPSSENHPPHVSAELVSVYAETTLVNDARWQVPFKFAAGVLFFIGAAFLLASAAHARAIDIEHWTIDTEEISQEEFKRAILFSPENAHGDSLELCVDKDARYAHPCGARTWGDPNFLKNAEVNIAANRDLLHRLEKTPCPRGLEIVCRTTQESVAASAWIQETLLKYYRSGDMADLSQPYQTADPKTACAAELVILAQAKTPEERYAAAKFKWQNCMAAALHKTLNNDASENHWQTFLTKYKIVDHAYDGDQD